MDYGLQWSHSLLSEFSLLQRCAVGEYLSCFALEHLTSVLGVITYWLLLGQLFSPLSTSTGQAGQIRGGVFKVAWPWIKLLQGSGHLLTLALQALSMIIWTQQGQSQDVSILAASHIRKWACAQVCVQRMMPVPGFCIADGKGKFLFCWTLRASEGC